MNGFRQHCRTAAQSSSNEFGNGDSDISGYRRKNGSFRFTCHTHSIQAATSEQAHKNPLVLPIFACFRRLQLVPFSSLFSFFFKLCTLYAVMAAGWLLEAH